MRSVAAVLLCLMVLSTVVVPGPSSGGPAGWSAEERLTVDLPTAATGLEVEVNDHGSAIAAWNCWDRSALRSVAWVSLYDPERGWSGGTLLDGTSYSSSVEGTAINDNGTAMAAWTVEKNGSYHPMAAMYLAGEGWQERKTLSTLQASATYDADVAINGNGEAVMAWDATIGGSYHIMASIYSPSTGWSAAASLIDSANFQGHPMVGISEKGDVLVAWTERLENPDHTYTGILRYCTYGAVTGWSVQAMVNGDDVDQGSPVAHMDMNSKGSALLAYSCEVAGSSRSESRAAFYDGISWSPAVTLSAEDGVESACPDVGLADDGWGIVVWAEWRGGISEYQYRTFQNGTFGEREVIPHGAMSDLNWPSIDVSAGGRALATTKASMDGETVTHAYAVRYSRVDGWSSWERLDTNSLSPIYFLVKGGIDSAGNCAAAWLSYDDASMLNISAWASTYTAPGVTVQEVGPQEEIDSLRGQLGLAIIAAVTAIALALASLGLLFWKGRKK